MKKLIGKITVLFVLKAVLIACFVWQAGARDWKVAILAIVGIGIAFLLGSFYDRKWMALPVLPFVVLIVATVLGLINPDIVLSNKAIFALTFRLVIVVPLILALWKEIQKSAYQPSLCA